MNTITVNFCVKEPKSYLNYYKNSFSVETKENFSLEKLAKEVNNLPKQKRKKMLQITKAFILTTVPFLTYALKSTAASSMTSNSLQQMATVSPLSIFEPLTQLLQMALIAVFLLAILFLFEAGFLRMIKKKKEAVEWTEDIIMGLVQVVVSIPIVFLIYFIVTSLFGDFNTFLDVFKPQSNN